MKPGIICFIIANFGVLKRNAFLGMMKRTKVKELLAAAPAGTDVMVKGWVRTKRDSKGIIFLAVNDGSTINNIQVVAEAAKFDTGLLKDINTGASVAVKGRLVESHGKGRELRSRPLRLSSMERPTPKYTLSRKRVTPSNSSAR